MPTERTVTSSTYGITASNRMKLKSASGTISFAVEIIGAWMKFIYLEGRTDRGRKLALVFQDKGYGIVRVFTGWDLIPKKNQ